MPESTQIRHSETAETSLPNDTTHLRIAEKKRDSQDNADEETNLENTEFNASETYLKLKQKIRSLVDQHATELSMMSRQDYMILTQQMVNHPKLGTVTSLILENFKGWSAESNSGIDRQEIITLAKNIADQIDQIPDEDFFGDMSDIESKHTDLYRLYMKDANKKADMTIIGVQLSQRANRLKAA